MYKKWCPSVVLAAALVSVSVLALGVVSPAMAKIVTTTTKIGGVDVEVRRPGNASYPLIVFTHGAGSCPNKYTRLLGQLANAGYMVVAVKHQDCFTGSTKPDVSWREPKSWNDTTNSARRNDIHRLLDAMANSAYGKYVESFDQVGCMGHSLGGYTCMGLAGAWASWKRPQITAIAALSPWHRPFTLQNRVGDISGVSVLYQGGTKDKPITPELTEKGGAYDQTQVPKYMQVFKRARHSAFTDGRLGQRFHDEMGYYLVSFFNATLKSGDVKKLRVTKPRVDGLRFKTKK